MCPPGLATVSVPQHVLARAKRSRSFYFDWRANKQAQDKLDAAFTPAVSLIRSLDVALGLILEDGLDAAFERHIRLGRAARAGIKAMGLELFSPDDDTAAVVTAVRAPEGVDGDELLIHLRDRHGVTLAPGQAHLKVDCRVPPGLGEAEVREAVEAIVPAGDWDISFDEQVVGNRSPAEGPLWDAITGFIAREDPDAVVAASGLPGFTDSRWFREAFPGCIAYGFMPARAFDLFEAAPLIHSADERVPVEDLGMAARFFAELAPAILGS
jgi:acetylornithine deacetylase/succinyl-diaminopimelate desuccinylase-like protein